MTLGAPSPDQHWYFADGDKSANSSESLTLLNPADIPATVTVQIFTSIPGGDDFVTVQTYDVAEGAVEKVDIDAIAGIPAGRHTLVVDSVDVPIVAEQVITRGSGGGAVTVVGLGSRISSTRWWVPTPIQDIGAASLVISNQTGESGTFSVFALGPGGLQPVEGYQNLTLSAASDFVGGFVDIDLTNAGVLSRPLLIESSVPSVVLRRPARGPNLKGRTAVLAVPEI
jgi:hypothetical protein